MSARRLRRSNPLAFAGALAWLAVVGTPLFYLVATSLRTREEYLTAGPLSLPLPATLQNYRAVLEGGFGRYVVNTTIVTAASVALVCLLALPAAYAIVRGSGTSRLVRTGLSLFLLGLAIPAQMAIVPIYLMITRMHLYDSLTAIVLPTVAFSLPISVLVLTSTLRDIPEELYDAMIVDGADRVRTMRFLVLPLSQPGLVTIGIYTALSAWNGFLFPLVLTQSADKRVLTMALWEFQGEFTVDIPRLMAAVVLSALPVLALYVLGRRRLISGLTAGGFGK